MTVAPAGRSCDLGRVHGACRAIDARQPYAGGRLLATAQADVVAGAPAQARARLDEALPHLDDPLGRAEADRLRARSAFRSATSPPHPRYSSPRRGRSHPDDPRPRATHSSTRSRPRSSPAQRPPTRAPSTSPRRPGHSLYPPALHRRSVTTCSTASRCCSRKATQPPRPCCVARSRELGWTTTHRRPQNSCAGWGSVAGPPARAS